MKRPPRAPPSSLSLLLTLAACTPAAQPPVTQPDLMMCVEQQVACAGACVDTATDPRNCGACGAACKPGLVCAAGKCARSCDAGQSVCSDICVSLATDNANCGACGTKCPAGTMCSAGKCAVTCGAGLTECGGACKDTKSDPVYCGACNIACKTGEVCSAGKCGAVCPTGSTLCGDGKCHDLSSDNAHCGACSTAGTTDKACAAGTACTGGTCVAACPAGSTLCGDGKCHDLLNDNQHCGGCSSTGNDKSCPGGSVCSGGTCQGGCGGGTLLCNDGKCHDILNDNFHCGGCGKVCAAGSVCANGNCVATCGAPLVQCNTKCVDARFDPDNCGGCGNACPSYPNASRACANNTCFLAQCNTGSLNCNNNNNDGCEVPVAADPNNCGGCGKVCPAVTNGSAGCSGGVCGVGACNAGFGNCDGNGANGCETNTNTNAAHCGGCNMPCGQGKGCANGMCTTVMNLRQLAGTHTQNVTRGTTYNSFFSDPATGKIYWAQSHSAQTFTEFPDLTNWVNNTNGRTFTLQNQSEGTYQMALNGHIYYNIFNTNTIAKARVSDGMNVATATLAGAGFHNQSAWQWGGYTDIDWYVDTGNVLYVLYAAPGGGNLTVSRVDPNTLMLQQTWTIPRAKQSTGYAFIAGGIVYIGPQYTSTSITVTYNLMTSTYSTNYSNALSSSGGSEYIASVRWDPSSNMLFEVSSGKHLVYPNALQ